MFALRLPVDVYLVVPPLLGWGLEKLIWAAQPQLHLVGTAESLSAAVAEVDKKLPDVLVIDADDGCTVDELCEFCRTTRVRVVALCGNQEARGLERAVVDGLRGVVDKHEAPLVLLRVIEKVSEGELWLGRETSERVLMHMATERPGGDKEPSDARIATLTFRERQTISALVHDAAAPAKVIASRLCMSEHTLRNHLTSIYGKLGVANRVDLQAFAAKHSLDRHA